MQEKMEKPVIEPGDEILIRYQVFADKDVVDASSKPIKIKVGTGKFMPVVEEALIGRSPGEHVTIWVAPEEHYGKYDPKKLQLVPAEKIPEGLSPGAIVKIQDEYGVIHPAILKKVEEGLAVVDFNHPLAGKHLRFEVDILEVKKPEKRHELNEAQEEEV
ncbi:FKBP-type peptidyl-prolyl cis-trans isomerase [Thermodesulfatator atlanticus]|uniref:FKBP-type peptidyl-prolyl cis-trans isomerase n=1 Tax=Thermodesulfatator atlanticus TaxID=501497 RepID=UPI0003B62EE4|nr:FKBP-type peptidyl-prolyl cis-trans isomerase [Thermodesulfatator atlanticus]